MRNKFGWGEAFITAGMGCWLVLVVLPNETLQTSCRNEASTRRRYQTSLKFYKVFLPAIIAGAPVGSYRRNFGSDSTDAFIFACIPVIYFMFLFISK